jgi:hypothetical protein
LIFTRTCCFLHFFFAAATALPTGLAAADAGAAATRIAATAAIGNARCTRATVWGLSSVAQ